ncbi:HEAT repeat-containing protein 1 [Bulinus truncatus]|nr:HEAT repeat-containing protein 1 [Bulinus truncatus]
MTAIYLVNLLPDSMFMDIVSGLMNHSLPLVQRRAMELLNNKLQLYKENLTSVQIEMLLKMTAKLIKIASSCLLKGGKGVVKEENLVNGQIALYSLKVMCRVLGDKHDKLSEILQLCIKVLSRHNDNGMVSASSLLCVAEVVGCLKLHTIEFLTQFMPLVINHLKSPVITQHEVLLLAAITSLQKIVESMSAFLSPFLMDIIVQVCLISSCVESQSDAHRPIVLQKIKHICTTLSTMTPTRTFLPVLEKSLKALDNKFVSSAECAMSMLKDHIVKMSKEDLTTFSTDLLKFFLSCFDIRATHLEISDYDLNVIEQYVIDAFSCLVFKLSEAQFKPMLLQIYNWATEEDVSSERLIVFYRLCDSLAGKLKNLFTLFAGHIIKHSAEMLDINNRSKQKCTFYGKGKAARVKSCQLLAYILDCLQKTFAHDTEGFLTKERFDIVMQPLVDQLENTVGKPSVCEDRIFNHVVPCIASFAAAAHDDSLWKDLNYQILLKTRHENHKVRIWALAAVDAFHKQLGEDYTQLVPETIPFMAELMEDESDEVEKYTQKVLAAMEVSVGENLQEYF